MRKIILLPTWLLVCIFKPFLKSNNPIKNISFDNWKQHAAELTYIFSFYFWISTICFLILFTLYLVR